jgi:hypothetical protein
MNSNRIPKSTIVSNVAGSARREPPPLFVLPRGLSATIRPQFRALEAGLFAILAARE